MFECWVESGIRQVCHDLGTQVRQLAPSWVVGDDHDTAYLGAPHRRRNRVLGEGESEPLAHRARKVVQPGLGDRCLFDREDERPRRLQ